MVIAVGVFGTDGDARTALVSGGLGALGTQIKGTSEEIIYEHDVREPRYPSNHS